MNYQQISFFEFSKNYPILRTRIRRKQTLTTEELSVLKEFLVSYCRDYLREDEMERAVHLIDSIEANRYWWIFVRLVEEFSIDPL